jgi:hypothetical protein
MSRTLRKAVETAKQKKETEINLSDEGIAHLEEVPELCKFTKCVFERRF